MENHRSSFWYGSLLLLLCLLLQPAGIGAQCVITMTDMGTGTQGGKNYRYGVKYLSMNFQCTVTMQMNMIGCSPDPAASTDTLSAAAFTTAVDPTCSWTCTCGAVTITNVDLPVELMDFGIDDGSGEDGDADGAG